MISANLDKPVKINDIKKAYFIGIKGSGMSSVAQILHDRDIKVSGSDTDEVFYTDKILKRKGIKFHEEFSEKNIPKDADVVIYSSAYNEDNNVEMAEAAKRKIPILSYSEILGMLFKEKTGIAVCGSHGKTTTTAILADVMKNAGFDPSAVVGSQVISWQGSALSGKGKYFIAEADEYQNKLRYYSPWAAILTSVDWDHPDFFPDFSSYKKAFEDFVSRIPEVGLLVVWGDSIDTLEVSKKACSRTVTYGFDDECDYRISDFRFLDPKPDPLMAGISDDFSSSLPQSQNSMQSAFEIFKGEENLGTFETLLVGKHNALNIASVVAFCSEMSIDIEKVREAVREFKGTSRRYEKIGKYKDAVLIDDYAHHPDEIRATLKAARGNFGDKTIWTVFHPHTFTRTKALLHEFSQSFDDTDKVIIIDIYGSAREYKGGVSSKDLVDLINIYLPGRADYFPTIDEATQYLRETSGRYDVLITMGAGDVWKIAEKLKDKR